MEAAAPSAPAANVRRSVAPPPRRPPPPARRGRCCCSAGLLDQILANAEEEQEADGAGEGAAAANLVIGVTASGDAAVGVAPVGDDAAEASSNGVAVAALKAERDAALVEATRVKASYELRAQSLNKPGWFNLRTSQAWEAPSPTEEAPSPTEPPVQTGWFNLPFCGARSGKTPRPPVQTVKTGWF